MRIGLRCFITFWPSDYRFGDNHSWCWQNQTILMRFSVQHFTRFLFRWMHQSSSLPSYCLRFTWSLRSTYFMFSFSDSIFFIQETPFVTYYFVGSPSQKVYKECYISSLELIGMHCYRSLFTLDFYIAHSSTKPFIWLNAVWIKNKCSFCLCHT